MLATTRNHVLAKVLEIKVTCLFGLDCYLHLHVLRKVTEGFFALCNIVWAGHSMY